MPESPHLGDPLPPPSALMPAEGSPTPFHRQLVVFENGAPVVRDVPTMSKETLRDLGSAVLAKIYHDPADDLAIEMGLPPSRFYGMTLAEVMLTKRAEEAARTGDNDLVEAIQDRELGKPKQTTESHKTIESYEEFTKRVARDEDEARLNKAKPIVVDVAPEDLL